MCPKSVVASNWNNRNVSHGTHLKADSPMELSPLLQCILKVLSDSPPSLPEQHRACPYHRLCYLKAGISDTLQRHTRVEEQRFKALAGMIRLR